MTVAAVTLAWHPLEMPARNRPGRPGRHEEPAPQRQRTIHIPAELDREYVALAAREGTSVQAVLRRALAEWMAQHRA
jgi:hypothetical protein